jgi:hypothetical protein
LFYGEDFQLKIGFRKPIPNRKDSPPYEAYSLRPVEAIYTGAAGGFVPDAARKS